ncbi:MAG: hypothetical protein R3F22_06750 [Lysobacteraceae bacterium]
MSDNADAATKPKPRRRWRWLLWLLAILLAIGFGVSRLLQPEKLGELLLTQINERSGLVVTTGEPAQVGWWPGLHVELRGVDARIPGDDAALLQAEAIDLSLPLSLLSDALRGNEIQPRITGLTLRAPALDTVRLQHWLGPDDGPPAPFVLPEIDSPLAIEDGTIIGDGWQVEALDVALSDLHAGQASKLSGSLNYRSTPSPGDEDPLPLRFDITATPSLDTGDLRLDPLRVELASGEDTVTGSGSLRLTPAGGLVTTLELTTERWPQLLPALPLPPENQRFDVSVDFNGHSRGSGQLRLDIRGEADRIRGELAVGDWLAWLSDGEASAWTLPPISGSLTATRLQQGDIVLTEAVIDFDDGMQASEDNAASTP